MNTKTTQSWELSEDDIKVAIAEWLEKKFGKGNPITVSVRAVAYSSGFGMNESVSYRAEITAKRDA